MKYTKKNKKFGINADRDCMYTFQSLKLQLPNFCTTNSKALIQEVHMRAAYQSTNYCPRFGIKQREILEFPRPA